MADSLTANDPRYREIFDVSKEAAQHGEVYGDLTPAMNALRNRASVMQGSLRSLLDIPAMHDAFSRPRPHYTFLTFALCERAFRENKLFSSEVYQESPGVQSLGRTILEMVGDEHMRYRRVVQPMFIRPRAHTWWKQNWIDEAVDTLLDNLKDRTAADLNQDLCARLPMHVVTRGIGMNGEDAITFREHLLGGFRQDDMEARKRSMMEVARMLRELITARRQQPADDVVSGLIANDFKQTDGSSRKLTDEEIFGYCRLIMLAGGGTTWRQLGITLVQLMTNYQFWEACREKRELIEKAVEESARWMPTDPTFPRLITEDMELEGVSIAAGSRVDVCVGSANRDPARWENPDAYDIFRPSQVHIGFGIGPHQCLGMNVARQEMVSAISGLLDRFPNMHTDPSAPKPELLGGLEQRGMSSVPVRLQ
ncbi:MAG TPA: cytochrome P450 [Steroidobacteraceae bacterium]|nr:cytochrome P450 [Steroidobacteraceae bacterium]